MQPNENRTPGWRSPPGDCTCVTTAVGRVLVVDRTACVNGLPGVNGLPDTSATAPTEYGQLVADQLAPACRATILRHLRNRLVERIVVRNAWNVQRCPDHLVALYSAAARFSRLVSDRDARLAARALSDPIGAAREATGRGGIPSALAAEAGLALCATALVGAEPHVDEHTDVARQVSSPPADPVESTSALSREFVSAGMFADDRTAVPDTPRALREEYDNELRDLIRERGVDEVVAAADVDRSTIESLAAGESPDISVEDAAAVRALLEDVPDAEELVDLACDHLLLGMTMAVMDVDALAAELDPALDLEPRDVQQKIERRAPMSFDEFVEIQHAIARNRP